MSDKMNISTVCFQGKKKTESVNISQFICSIIVQPTIVPIRMPSKHAANTNTSASQKYKSVILIRVMPIALKMPISLAWSYKLALIDALKLKKLRNIMMAIVTMKTMSIIARISAVDCSFSQVSSGSTPVSSQSSLAIWSARAWSSGCFKLMSKREQTRSSIDNYVIQRS